jgi:hypothetical protein
LYIDRTFHWNLEVNKVLNIIPYTKNWIGFVHHTFDTTFSEYNNVNLLNCPEFIESLKYCKGLFVLSNYLKAQFEQEFQKRGICVNVYALVHPTDMNVEKFSYEKFCENPEKKLVHVGGWLRNIHSFYELELPNETIFKKYKWGIFPKKTTAKITKVALKGKNMNNYYPQDDFLEKLEECLITKCEKQEDNTQHQKQEEKNCSQNCSQNCSIGNNEHITNNWYKHFYKSTEDLIQNVKIIEHLGNSEYDRLITENIIFINLVDASAVNTVVECIVRQTPLIVNKHPAVVELLGDKYPLYYNDINEIEDILKDDSKIVRAHKHLKKMNTKICDIGYFVDQFVTCVKNLL